MVEGTLVAHADTARVSEGIVRAEPRPEFTPTWHPYSHAEILDVMEKACQKRKIEIVRKEYSIRKNSKMFGVWEVNIGHSDFNFAIGIRNSIDKSHSVGLCAGERVFVCDNLLFRGDFILFRKHTSRLDFEELTLIADETLEAVYFKFEELVEWHESLRKLSLSREQASLLIVAAMRKEIIPPSKFSKFYDLYFGSESKYSKTLHGFHGATTELMRENNLLTIQSKNDQLCRFIDHEVPYLVGARWSFEKIDELARKKYLEVHAKQKTEARATGEKIRQKAEEQRREKRRKKKEDPMRVLKAWEKGEKRLPRKVFKRIVRVGDTLKELLDQGQTYTLDCGMKIRAAKSKGFTLDNSPPSYLRSDLDDRPRKSALKLKLSSNIVRCPYCQSIITKDEKTCPSCGEKLQ